MMWRNFSGIFIFLFVPLFIVLDAGAAATNVSESKDEFIAEVLGQGDLPTAVQLLINKNTPIQMIIDEALKAGHGECAIISALYQSSLPNDQAVIESMQSRMSSGSVLNCLVQQGVSTEAVLQSLIKNKSDMSLILSTCQYMLKQDFTKFQMMEILMNAGADQDMIIKVAKRFNVPLATVMAAYQESQTQFGQVHNRSSLPQPALIAVGIAHIHANDVGRNRPVIISPSKP